MSMWNCQFMDNQESPGISRALEESAENANGQEGEERAIAKGQAGNKDANGPPLRNLQ